MFMSTYNFDNLKKKKEKGDFYDDTLPLKR